MIWYGMVWFGRAIGKALWHGKYMFKIYYDMMYVLYIMQNEE